MSCVATLWRRRVRCSARTISGRAASEVVSEVAPPAIAGVLYMPWSTGLNVSAAVGVPLWSVSVHS